MSRIIILEGVDGSGKSTLAQQLSLAYGGAPVLHHDQHTKTKEYVTKVVGSYLLANIGVLIIDRCWYSEPIYGAVYRGGTDRVGKANCQLLERIYSSQDTSVIYCNPGWSQVRANWARAMIEGKDEMLDSDIQLEQVYQLYRISVGQWKLPVVHYNYLTDSLDVIHNAPRTRPSDFTWEGFIE